MAATTPQTKTNFTSSKEHYEAGLMSLFAGKPEDAEKDLSKLFTPTFTQTDDDGVRDFPAFVAHIRTLREMSLKVNLNVTHFLRDGAQVADRHSSSTIMPDGSVGTAETYMFGGVAEDGRLEWISEVVIEQRAKN
jgi:hypothetical protein